MYEELIAIMKVQYGDQNYNNQLVAHYRERRMSPEQRVKAKNPRLFDMNVKEQADRAADILARTFKQKKKVEMGIHG